jgi:hypothetical protein
MSIYKGTNFIAGIPDLTNYALDADVVHKTGDETISGNKTFNNDIQGNLFGYVTRLLPGVTKGTDPNTTQYSGIFYINDSTNDSTWQNTRLGIAELSVLSDGTVSLYFGAYQNSAGSETNAMIQVSCTSSSLRRVNPSTDDTTTLGTPNRRWKQLYAGTTTISTSDERLKQNIEAIPDEVLDAWGEIGFYQFKYKDAVAEKGEENARWHTGLIAQRIKEVFEAHNLNAFEYGLLCYDEWEASDAVLDSQGNEITPQTESGDRYSLRYEECLCLEVAYQRRKADRLEQRLSALETKFAEIEEPEEE